jgi:hypothetical protein
MGVEHGVGEGRRRAPEAPLALEARKPQGEGQPVILSEGLALGGLIAKKQAPAVLEVPEH